MNNYRFFSGIGCVSLVAVLTALAGCASTSPAPVVERGGQRVAAPAQLPNTYVVKGGDTVYSIARDHGMDYRELIAMNGIENPNQISVGRVLKVKPKSNGNGAVPSDVAVTAPVTSDVVVSRPIGEAPPPPTIEKRPGEGNTERFKREPKAGKEPYSEQALALAQGQGQPKPVEPPPPPVAKPDEKPVEPAPAGGGDEVPWIWPAGGKVIGTFSDNGSKGIDISGRAGDSVVAAGDGKVVYSGTGLRGYGKLVIIKHNNTYLSAYAHNQNILVKEGQSVTKGQKIAEMGNTDADQVKLHFEVRRQGKPVDPLKHLPPR